ncbi:SPW repeat protein [Ramlibacter ginsenosidimutans]|uniref:SPW repeat protein n=1 Tax=Ramlibacter ginsenosidimutans TaxID=502333 RepID=A0A934TWR9_9BURK|nr:SPW repeat protein [Ramlibacter ginsenosidimutans]MBK6008790.1 SPW repeat protein [Ramlibacter ginsenosidimutans]
MTRVKHWQDPVNALVGVWLVLSPWALGFQNVVIATTTTMGIGALLFASSVGAMQFPQDWEEWLDVVLGVVLMLLPVVFGFDDVQPALVNAMVSGAIVTLLALWVLASDDVLAGWWERNVG